MFYNVLVDNKPAIIEDSNEFVCNTFACMDLAKQYAFRFIYKCSVPDSITFANSSPDEVMIPGHKIEIVLKPIDLDFEKRFIHHTVADFLSSCRVGGFFPKLQCSESYMYRTFKFNAEAHNKQLFLKHIAKHFGHKELKIFEHLYNKNMISEK